MKWKIGRLILVLVILTLIACLNTATSVNQPKLILESLSNSVIAPRFNNMVENATPLVESIQTLCNMPSREQLEQSRTEWRKLRSSWRQLEPFYFGPHSQIPTRYGRILDFWPVREAKIEDLIAAQTPISGDLLGNQGAVVRGIPALEYVLFGSPSDFILDDIEGRRICNVALAMAEDIEVLSTLLRDQWLREPDGFIKSLSDPTSGEFLNERGALSELVNRIGFTIENIRIEQLGVPLGDKVGGQLLPELVSSRYSDHSLDDIRQALNTIEALVEGAEAPEAYGLRDMPRLGEREDIIDSFRQALLSVHRAIDEIPPPLRLSLNQTALVRTVYDRLGDLQRIIQGDMINVLGLSLAFNDADGD